MKQWIRPLSEPQCRKRVETFITAYGTNTTKDVSANSYVYICNGIGRYEKVSLTPFGTTL